MLALTQNIEIPDFLLDKNCILLNSDFDLIYVSIDFEKIIGTHIENYCLIYNDTLLTKKETYIPLFKNPKGFYNIEFELLNFDNQPVSLIFNGFSFDNYGETFYVIFYNNITEIKNFQRKYFTKEIELNTLIYKISHDLRGPMASIKGLLNLIGFNDKNSTEHYLELIEKSVENLDRKINDLSHISHLDGSEKYFYEEIDIHDLIYNSINKISKKYDVYDIVYDFNIKLANKIKTYSYALESIFTHLFIHCIENKKENLKSLFKLDINIVNNILEIIFVDNGKGVEDDCIDKIFAPFYQINETHNHSTLSLFAIKKNVDFMNGNIYFRSKLDIGSEIKIFLPLL